MLTFTETCVLPTSARESHGKSFVLDNNVNDVCRLSFGIWLIETIGSQLTGTKNISNTSNFMVWFILRTVKHGFTHCCYSDFFQTGPPLPSEAKWQQLFFIGNRNFDNTSLNCTDSSINGVSWKNGDKRSQARCKFLLRLFISDLCLMVFCFSPLILSISCGISSHSLVENVVHWLDRPIKEIYRPK